jgi:hypothetical protein
LGLPTKDAALAQRKAWRDRAQTGPSMRSASASEDKRSTMGRHHGLGAPSRTSSDALLKRSVNIASVRCNTFGPHTTVHARAKNVNDLTSARLEETEMSAPLYLGSLAPLSH